MMFLILVAVFGLVLGAALMAPQLSSRGLAAVMLFVYSALSVAVSCVP